MFKHEKQLFHPLAGERPNSQYAALLQEQPGGGNGDYVTVTGDLCVDLPSNIASEQRAKVVYEYTILIGTFCGHDFSLYQRYSIAVAS